MPPCGQDSFLSSFPPQSQNGFSQMVPTQRSSNLEIGVGPPLPQFEARS